MRAGKRQSEAGTRRRSVVLSVLSTLTVAGLVIGIAVFGQGFDRLAPRLESGSVWVANGARALVGQANTEIGRLNSALATTPGDTRILQGPTRVTLHNGAENTLTVLDPALATVRETVPLPAGNPRVVEAGESLLIHVPESGDVWRTSIEELSGFRADSAPEMNIGVDAVLSADADGNYAGYSPKSGQLVTGSLSGGSAPQTRSIPFSEPPTDPLISLIGGRAVILSPGGAEGTADAASTGELWAGEHLIPLRGLGSDARTARILAPSVDAPRLLIATEDGVLAVSPGAQSAVPVYAGPEVSGQPAIPVRVEGCDYLVWSGGQALRACGDNALAAFTLTGTSAANVPLIAVNAGSVVANDPLTGATWELRREGKSINNWVDFTDDQVSDASRENERDVPPETETLQKPPIAEDDSFGVRAGRGNVLPVLLNDSDPNGDPLLISAVTEIDREVGRLSIIENAQKIQFTPGPEMPTELRFGYTIDDGFGNSDSATVTLTLRAPGENSPPVQVRQTRTSVAEAGTARLSILDDWIDPDSDPMYLAHASTGEPDTVTHSPDGVARFSEGGGIGETRTIAVSVSDGVSLGTGAASVSVGAPGTVPLIAESFTAVGYAQQDISVSVLDSVRGGTGRVSLTGVSSEGNEGTVRITPDYASGTFTLAASRPGNFRAEYSVTDGNLNAAGIVRFAIMPSPEGESTPVTVPVTSFLYLQNTTLVDVLAPASDPAGGVLTLSAVEAPPEGSGITIEVLEHRMLRVTLKSGLGGAPVPIGFTVSNGTTSAEGVLTLVEVPEPDRLQPPVAQPDAAEVRVGTVVEIPVLDNDVQPNGKPLTLSDTLSEGLAAGEGTLFVDGDRLRYLAPQTPGTYVARYRVSSTDGQWAEAPVTLTVREVDAAHNRPPVPRTVTARAVAGKTVTIPIPLDGIDPDGDAVTLSGVSTNPALGAVSGVGRDTIEYTAGAFSGGTDTLEYGVVDALGAAGTGTIRIGVLPAGADAGNPIAMDDLVATRPGTSLSVPILDNDSDPERGELSLVSIEPGPGVSAEIRGNQVALEAPRMPGSYGILYTVTNARGGQSSAWLYVQVAEDAPLARPRARDIVLSAQDTIGRERVLVDPLKLVTFTEGTTRDLTLGIEPGFPDAVVTEAGRIEVAVEKQARIIPFRVSRNDSPELFSLAFIWVPGNSETRPELRRDAQPLRVASGETLRIRLQDHVVVARGRTPTLSDPDGVSANNSNGQRLASGDNTLVFVSAPGYFGPASITFTVTDGTDRLGSSATLTLPIEVTPLEAQPAILTASALGLEAGSERVLDLQALTDIADSTQRSRLAYTAVSADRAVVDAEVSGSELTLRVPEGVRSGAQTTVQLSVRSGRLEGVPAVLTVQIVSSTRPLVSPIPDSLVVRRGGSASVFVLDNDEATNPFPGTPLRVVSVGEGVVLPPGIRLSTSGDKRRVSVSVSVDRTARTGDLTVPYRVVDSTDDPQRIATGYISVRIQDVPDAPGRPQPVSTDVGSASAVLAIPHAYPNHSEITAYRVVSADGSVQAECGNPGSCVVRGLQFGVDYRFRAQAVNALGAGNLGELGGVVVVDGTPNAPSGVKLVAAAEEHRPRLVASWTAGSGGSPGSTIESYEVRISGPGVEYSRVVGARVSTVDIVDGVRAAANYTVSVTARNRTKTGPPARAEAVAVGPPLLGEVTAELSADTPDSPATISWTGADGQGSSRMRVKVWRHDVDLVVCEREVSAGSGGCVDNTGIVGASYAVEISNGLFTTRVDSNRIQPSTPSILGAWVSGVVADSGDMHIDISGVYTDSPLGAFDITYVLRTDAGETERRELSGLIRPTPEMFGSRVEVGLRACRGEGFETCGAEYVAGPTITPLRTRVEVLSCPAPGSIPQLRAPENGSITSVLEVRYYASSAAGVQPLGPWQPADTPVPEVPEDADAVRVSARATIRGQTFTPSLPPEASCATGEGFGATRITDTWPASIRQIISTRERAQP
ncbi:fibronectin type III domain-containing protein [Mycetocola tolaasinivorans]|uniref:Fibronectin type III domain-containing protein n=1 Tax=Mycetocola tolaasinivorans TaxID=76635 RepID=A0A3L7A919_9MICO|nr:Ig-like domain-containing protein [Mycetocola tolaasinivorans]RLP76081.1 fibronectin type III domain-containing protein [Mycetocola tolaasinivorans]